MLVYNSSQKRKSWDSTFNSKEEIISKNNSTLLIPKPSKAIPKRKSLTEKQEKISDELLLKIAQTITEKHLGEGYKCIENIYEYKQKYTKLIQVEKLGDSPINMLSYGVFDLKSIYPPQCFENKIIFYAHQNMIPYQVTVEFFSKKSLECTESKLTVCCTLLSYYN